MFKARRMDQTMSAKKGAFTRVKKASQRPMYGPRGLLVCGMNEPLRRTFLDGISALGFRDLPIVFVGAAHLDHQVGDLFQRVEEPKVMGPERAPLAIVMSGMSEKELHMLIGAYRRSRLPRPLWASLTPISEQWPLSKLLAELAAERAAMASGGKRPSSS